MADDLDKNNSSFEDDTDFGSDEEFDDFSTDSSGFGSAIQNNTALKIGIVVAAFVFIIGGFILFGGGEDEGRQSQMQSGRANEVNEPPATTEVSKNMRNAIEDYNEEGVEQAATSEESFIPVPVGPPTSTGIEIEEEESQQSDPLERWRVLQEERARQQRQQVEVSEQSNQQAQADNAQRQEAVSQLSQAMLSGMQELVGEEQQASMQTANITSREYLEEQAQAEQAQLVSGSGNGQGQNNMQQGQGQGPQTQSAADQQEEAEVLISEGDVEYAQMLIQANSDVPGPILAELVTGPLAGSRLVGQFETTDDYLILNFETVIIDKRSVPIDAVAVDPDTNLTGVATEVNRRYLKRVALPAAASFVEGLTEAIASSGRTNVTITGDSVVSAEENDDLSTDQEVATGISEAGEQLGEFLEEEADETEPLIRVAAGTPVGVLFLSPLLEGGADNQPAYQQTQDQQQQFQQFQQFQNQLNQINAQQRRRQRGMNGLGANN